MRTKEVLFAFLRLGALPLMVVGVFAISAQATTVNPLDLPDLVDKAEVIADVTVTNAQPYVYYAQDGRSVHTRVTFKVNGTPIKGNVSSPLVLDFLGGSVGYLKMVVSGVPQLQVGQRLIIFSHAPNNFYVSPFVGLDQGALRVVRDEATQSDRVLRWWGQPVSENESMKSRQVTAQRSEAEAAQSAEPVEHFLNRVRTLAVQ
jgi:hypothetical protein